MSDDQNPVDNDPSNQPDPSGTSPDPVDSGASEDKVSYDTYKKILAEKKAAQAKLDEYQKESERREAQKLEEQQKYKELYENAKTETQSLSEKVQAYETRWQDAIKLTAFHDALGDTKKIDSKYSGFIDTSKILVDPESGKIDKVSVQKEVERVTNSYPEIVKSTITSHLPNQSPSSNGTLTPEQWRKLPLAEMKKRRKEVKL